MPEFGSTGQYGGDPLFSPTPVLALQPEADARTADAMELAIADLPDQYKSFVIKYLAGRIKWLAAFQAGFGHDRDSAGVQAARLMAHPKVLAAIRACQAAERAEYAYLRHALLQSILEDAYFDPTEAFDANGTLKPLPDMPAYVRQRIVAYSAALPGESPGKVTFVDRQKAKTQLLQILGVGQPSKGLELTIQLGGEGAKGREKDHLGAPSDVLLQL